MVAAKDRFDNLIHLSETDIVASMKDIQDYIDISTGRQQYPQNPGKFRILVVGKKLIFDQQSDNSR